MESIKPILAILIAFAVGFLLGRATVQKEEIIVQERGETVHGRLNHDVLTKPVEFGGDVKDLPRYLWITDTVRVKEVEYVATIPDTTKIIEDFLTRREYDFNVFDDDNGKLDVKQVVQYNRLQDFSYSFTPVRTIVTRVDRPLFTPFVSASYSTFNTVGLGGGVFIKDIGLEYQYQFNQNQTGHMIGIKYKF